MNNCCSSRHFVARTFQIFHPILIVSWIKFCWQILFIFRMNISWRPPYIHKYLININRTYVKKYLSSIYQVYGAQKKLMSVVVVLCPNTSSPFQQRNWIEEEIRVWWKWAKHPPHIKGEKDPLTPAEDYDELNKRLFTSRTVNIICFQLFSSSKNIYEELALGVPLTRDLWRVKCEQWMSEIFMGDIYVCMEALRSFSS